MTELLFEVWYEAVGQPFRKGETTNNWDKALAILRGRNYMAYYIGSSDDDVTVVPGCGEIRKVMQ